MSSVMGDPKTVLEGGVKYRDKKKWKSRWAVVSKLSPVADCLHIQLYRDSKDRCKNGPTKASLSLEEFLGLESGFTLDKESHTLAIICSELVVVLAFDNRELLIQWQVKIRANLVEEQQFLVQIAHVPPKSKLPCGPARLHLQDHTFCLVSGVPPRLLGTWPIKELRRFGVVEGKFCFEGGSLCGKGEGLHVLLTNQCEELSQAMDLASKGKLQGKRKTLARKNSVLETSSRMPLHKRCHLDSGSKSVSGDSRPLLSSGSECSTCDACSEVILRTNDGEDLMYSSSACSMKASSCRIHYRWPSCLSRWGQSSTTTTSDMDSVDTVSVILSDMQGSSHSATMSKTNGHGQSLSCLCDTQGTWPFNQCTKCGREFYGRGNQQSAKCKAVEDTTNEDTSGFSPHWTMDSLVGSVSSGGTPSKKELLYPPSDHVSLCSHASQSSSASAASSSGSGYSVPKNFLESSLYDTPKSIQYALNGFTNIKTIRTNGCQPDKSVTTQPSSENCIVCPCHDPIKDWTSESNSQEKLVSAGNSECACWNKLSMTGKNETDVRVVNGRKSASANPSPSSSPKKSKYNTAVAAMRPSRNDCDVCTCRKDDSYGNYSVPRSTTMQTKGPLPIAKHLIGNKDIKQGPPANPLEDYDVPKKFSDLLSNCDMIQKSPAMKSINNGPSCSCMSACKIVQNIELFKMASKHSYNHKHGTLNTMCACQRVMLWAGSLVPCLGPQSNTMETGWQCTKSLATDGTGCSRAWYNHTQAVCSEPHRTAEAVMANGKVKHVLRDISMESPCENMRTQPQRPFRPRASTVSYSLSKEPVSESFNYANVDLSSDLERNVIKVSEDSSAANYANIEFADSLSLYENSSAVLSRLKGSEKNEMMLPNKPPLPPRSHLNKNKKLASNKESQIKDSRQTTCVNVSPKKTALKQLNGSAYEMMCYEKNPASNQSDEDYLLMQPLCLQDGNSSPTKPTPTTTETIVLSSDLVENCVSEPQLDLQSNLPLRPFLPYSYSTGEVNNSEGISGDCLLRKNQLINELHIRAMRSNSLSELKKVLMRKRSSSVDGKNNGYISKDSGTESVPASPMSSPRLTAQRKNSLFSKLNLRSKEKSMSTNEIVFPMPITSDIVCSSNMNKSVIHRSADCLKMNDEFNSEEDLNSDNSDFVQKNSYSNSLMKRSSSVPCRAGMPTVSVTSPVKTNETILELNDLNKGTPVVPENDESPQESVQRKYSLDSHSSTKQRIYQSAPSNCDNLYRKENLDETDTLMEMQGILRRNPLPPSERGHVTDNCRSNTSSCSSSDISDYMESLSFISRSSSSSSGSTSSADYMRSEDIYRTAPIRPPPKTSACTIAIPTVHHSRYVFGADVNGTDVSHARSFNDPCESGSSSGSSHDKEVGPCSSTRCSRSSTSSLSTSPSVTDYSSSTSSSPPLHNLPTKLNCNQHNAKPKETRQFGQGVFLCSCSDKSDKTT